MALFRSALDQGNPFPHGLYWTGIKGSPVPSVVASLLELAKSKGVDSAYVPIETFDALLLRLWRNIEAKSPQMDAKVRQGANSFRSHSSAIDGPPKAASAVQRSSDHCHAAAMAWRYPSPVRRLE